MAKSRTAAPATRRLTDDERHKRFVDVAQSIGASEKEADFDRAFADVTKNGQQRKSGAKVSGAGGSGA
jgi:hypothetical protein